MSSNLLKDTGEVLYGPLWQSQLARDMNMSDRHMRRLVSGTANIKPGMYADLVRLCKERATAIDDVIARLKAASTP